MHADSQPHIVDRSGAAIDVTDTPRFKKPPVVETVLGVQFRPLPKINLSHYGRLYEMFQGRGFATIQQQPYVPHQLEQKNAPASILSLPFFAQGAQQQRYVFLSQPSADGQRFIQLQNDRLIQNWQRSNIQNSNYPSYSRNRKEFSELLAQFIDFAERADLAPIVFDQCEVTYDNQIPLDGFSGPEEALKECFEAVIPSRPLLHVECETQNASFQSTHWCDQVRGRLSIQVAIGVPVQLIGAQRQMIDFRITLRGAPEPQTIEGASNWLDLGHYIVTNTFADLTTEKMHKRWEREK